MSVEVDPAIAAEVHASSYPRAYVDPLEPGRRYFSVHLDCVVYIVVARDEAHCKTLMPAIHYALGGGTPDRSYAEAVADHGLEIKEIDGSTMICDDGRDGELHPMNTYALATWACSEY